MREVVLFLLSGLATSMFEFEVFELFLLVNNSNNATVMIVNE